MGRRNNWMLAMMTTLVAGAFIGCSDDTVQCQNDELYDQQNQTCVPRDPLVGADVGDTRLDDVAVDDVAVDDVAVENDTALSDGADTDLADTGADDDAAGQCDQDNDGVLAESCGGGDCDDTDPRRALGNREVCDTIDNDCIGGVNDHITCSFYAHSGDRLYEIDPFEPSATALGFSTTPGDDGDSLLDIDTHPDGTLFGITREHIYRLDTWAGAWVEQAGFSTNIGDANGLAIDSTGAAFITGEDKVYGAQLRNGSTTELGQTGNFYSSGDCVVNKGDTLYMTSKNQQEGEDTLVRVSRQTGQGQAVGRVGFQNVFGLTAAWGKLYGLTRDGELITIDPQTGEGQLIERFNDIAFYGAASTPNR